MTNEYVAAAYGVILFALLMYAVVIGLRSSRRAREAELLALLVERTGAGHDAPGCVLGTDALRAPGAPFRV